MTPDEALQHKWILRGWQTKDRKEELAARAACQVTEADSEQEKELHDDVKYVAKSMPRVSLAQHELPSNQQKLHLSQLSALCQQEFKLSVDSPCLAKQ